MLAAELALAGLAQGCIAALCGLGLIVTYQATGVFNLAFGAIGMLCAYLVWEAVEVWHVAVGPAAAVVVLVAAPGLGLALDRLVFRPLRRRGADAAEQLVATLGVLVLLIGAAVLIWGEQARGGAPSLFPTGSFRLPIGSGGLLVGYQTAGCLAVVVLLTALLTGLLRTRRLGLPARAAVDRRELAELAGVRTGRLAAAGWAAGGLLAGLAGVLIAPSLQLDPYGLTLVMLETVGVAVAARFTSLPIALAAALAVGIGQSEMSLVMPTGPAGPVYSAVQANLFAVLLLGALLVVPRLGARDARGASDAGAMRRFATRGRYPPPAGWWLPFPVLLALPLAFDPADLRAAQAVPALAVVFISLVVVTGYGGQVSLGQAGFAGLGALLAAWLAAGPDNSGGPALPGLLALLGAAALTGLAGLIAGGPVVRRRGLYLALLTFALAVGLDRFVFEQPFFTSNLTVARPAPFGGDRAFYLLELGCLGLALLAVRALRGSPRLSRLPAAGGFAARRGRTGRALLALRDSEPAAQAAGIGTTRLRLLVFGGGAALAGLGGALLSEASFSFDPSAFDPLQGLIWFAAVVVVGADSAAGAVLAAAAITALETGVAVGSSTALIGLGAVLLGRMPGGLAPTLRQAGAAVRAAADEAAGTDEADAAEALPGAADRAADQPAAGQLATEPPAGARLTARGREVAALIARRRAGTPS